MSALPLQGIRVVDLTVVWAGPFAAALLSDLGAEVIRVESIQRWDTIIRMAGDAAAMRAYGNRIPDDAPPWELSANFNTVGRNRRSVTMDLTRADGKEAFYRLISKCDVFVENNTPSVVHHLGINYELLRRQKPDLIMVSLSAYGATGPYRDYRAYGSNMEAMVGHALLRGYEDTDPTNNSSVFFADACGGATAAFAVLAALHHRHTTGEGQYIDMSQTENVGHTLTQAFMDYAMNHRVQKAMGNRDAAKAPQGVYPCLGEDTWLAISCATDAAFTALCRCLGRPELADEQRFAGGLRRYQNQDVLDHEIAGWTRSIDQYDAFHILQRAGVDAAPVLQLAQVLKDPHLRSRDMWQTVTHPVAGTHELFKPPISHMSETPLQYWRASPTLGQDNEYVYKEIMGFTDDEYQRYVDLGHIGTRFINR